MTTFGEFVKNLRNERRITLRGFCRSAGIDPGNWSKIERGLLPPPKSKEVIESVRKAIGLKQNSEEYTTLRELAVIGHVPVDLLDNRKVVDKLPVFFRTLRGEKPTREELENLIRIIENG
ncbi:MAG: helix-turn-helix domain-containing protein [Candidatus Marinimicrobia bacterium]|nr:helix-turn-helix domain-containing protein [Candidatus Neomarinimicrobiota bacterium]